MKRIDPGVLKISDGTIEIDLLELCFVEWRPNVLTIKGSATELDSPYSQGRQLVQAQFDDVTDLFSFNPKDESNDDLIEEIQDVRRLLEKARNYWLTEWQDEPVYLIARGQCETNTRYAQITNFLTPEDGNPYASPFNDDHIFEDWNLSITHRPWQEIEPGETVCAEAFAGKSTCIWSLFGDSTADNVTIPANAVIDDLPTGDFTVEAWIKPTGLPGSANIIISKGAVGQGWSFDFTGQTLRVDIQYSFLDAVSISSDDIETNQWIHVCFVWDNATATSSLYLNGIEQSYSIQIAGNGVYQVDNANNMLIGNDSTTTSYFKGYIGWVRISGIKRYNSSFSPPERCTLPQVDTNTIGLWIYEGNGATADNAEGTAAIDGTINNMEWSQGCVDNSDSYYGGGFDECLGGVNNPEINGSNISVPADASITDFPTADFTAEAWIKPKLSSINVLGDIYKKFGGGTWNFYIEDVVGGARLGFFAGFTITNVETITSTLIKYNQWSHVAVTFDLATLTASIWINGVEAEYSTQTAGAGVYNTDAAGTIRLTANGGGLIVPGLHGWYRLSGIERYTSSFSVPERCSLPTVDINTVGLWIYENQGSVAHNHPEASGGSAIDGSLMLVNFISLQDEGCCDDFGVCEKENYFGLFSSLTQITHVFWYDASLATYSSNMQGDNYWPRELLPNPNASGDLLYIGSDTTITNNGVFSNVIFDILNSEGLTPLTYTVEYWNGGAWAVIPNVKTGNLFDIGIDGIFYEIPSAWATTTINGTTGYWIRINTTNAGTIPIQQNRRVYTVNWPWIEFDEQAVPGDIAALARALICGDGRDDNESVGIPGFQRLVMALRSNSRGTAFNPYINISDVQQPCGLDVTKFGTGTWTTDIVNAPTGRYLSDTAVATGWQSMAAIVFDNELALDYYGDFRAYLLAKTSVGTIQYRLRLFESSNEVVIDPVTVIDTGVIEIVEFGEISIPLSDDIKNGEILSQFQIEIQANITAIGNVTEYYYLVLMPSDEYIIDTSNFELLNAVREDHPLDIDSIVYPKRVIRTWMKDESGDNTEFEISFQNDSVGAFFLQNNADQKLYFFGGIPGTNNWIQCLAVNAFQGFRNARYHSMRGSR